MTRFEYLQLRNEIKNRLTPSPLLLTIIAVVSAVAIIIAYIDIAVRHRTFVTQGIIAAFGTAGLLTLLFVSLNYVILYTQALRELNRDFMLGKSVEEFLDRNNLDDLFPRA